MAAKPAKKVDPKKTRLLAQKFEELSKLMKQQELMVARLTPVASRISNLRDEILAQFTAEELQSTTAGGLRVSRVKTDVPQVTDPMKFLAYATKKANWDLLSQKPASKAWRERYHNQVLVPGTKAFTAVSLQVNKVKP